MNTLVRKVQRLEDLHYLKCEMKLRQELCQRLEEERLKQELSDAAGTDDRDLIDALLQEGFTAESIPALSLFPVALVAWSSGFVTDEERVVAMQAVHDSEIAGNPHALAKFQSWLDSRPDQNLLRLWADFTNSQRQRILPYNQQIAADQVMQSVKRVALASGGFLGFGAICTNEQTVLQYVRDVFHGAAA